MVHVGSANQRTLEVSPADEENTSISLKQEAVQERKEICDKLIAVFRGRPSEDWRKLIVYSKQWPLLRDDFFKRWGCLTSVMSSH